MDGSGKHRNVVVAAEGERSTFPLSGVTSDLSSFPLPVSGYHERTRR